MQTLRISRTLSARLSEHDWSFGGKTIGFFGGLCLILNNAIGAGVAAIPLIFVRGGPIIPFIAMVVLGVCGAICAGMMCEAMRHVPGNDHFKGRVEYSKCVEYFMGKTWYRVTVCYLVAALMTMNIAAIIISAQGVDQALVMGRGKTCGLELSTFSWICSSSAGVNSPFTSAVITQGYLICLSLAIPLGLLNLDDNIVIQIISMFLCMFCIALWLYELIPEAEGDVKAYFKEDLSGYNYHDIIGSVMSNFAFVITVPSWCNEKVPSVSVNKTIWLSIVICVLVYGVLGFLAATVFGERITGSTNFLALMGNHRPGGLTAITCQFFPLLTALTGVPVCCIICRYNLLQSKIARSVGVANVIAVAIPWAISIPLQTLGNGSFLQDLLNYGSLLFASICNFVIPFLLYLAYRRRVGNRPEDNNLHARLMGLPPGVVQAPVHWALPGRQNSSSKDAFAIFGAILMVAMIIYTLFIST
eukprot:GEMP01040976.1.p1 GENE.GEMP01040976.1~~GEMP01040976.1.p1  ORF type:complete len:473 (+),score=50.51 GEMP01040976.1:259-1677(+)